MSYHILNNSHIFLSTDGKFISKISGMDMQAKMPIVFKAGDNIVFKRNGFTGWMCVGQTGYYPPVYYCVQVKDGKIISVLADVEVSRADWREVRDRLITLAKESQ